VLRNRNAVLFVGISLLSGFGGAAMSLVARVWVLELSGSSSLAALAGFCVYVPTLVGPVLGALVDRLPRRPLMVWTNLLTAAALLSLLTVRSAHQAWLIFAVMLGYGVSYVLLDAGEAALLPGALPAAALGAVNGLRSSAQEGMKLIAPLVGAVLFAWQGGQPVAVLTALVLSAAAGLYCLLRVGQASPTSTTRSSGQIRDGVRALWSIPGLRTVVFIGSVSIAMSGLSDAAVYSVVTDDLDRPAAFIGVLASAQGGGAILGGLIVGRLLRWRGELCVAVLGATLFAIGSAARCVPWWPVVVASSVVVGIGLPWTLVAAVTAVQTRTPEDLLGRVAATANSLLFAPVAVTIPIGAAIVLVEHHLPLLVAAIICLAAALLPLRHPRQEADPGRRAADGATAGTAAPPR